MFFVDGPGGSGKTYLYNTILAHYRANNEPAIAVASSGIAALLLEGGTTAHSRFRIPIDIHETSSCSISSNSREASILRRAKIVIWDEAPMSNKFCIEAVDRLFRDLMSVIDPALKNIPFGGKIVLFGGDFRQTLPVVLRGTKADIINSTLKSSFLWSHIQKFELTTNMRLTNTTNNDYRDFLLNLGNGTLPTTEINDVPDFIKLPDNNWIPLNETELFNRIFEDFHNNYDKSEYINNRAILCLLNKEVEDINTNISNLVPGQPTTYLSIDLIIDNHNNNNLYFTPEYLNQLNISGIPHHRLELKLNQPIILMRNITKGLCNGTRLIIKGISF